MDRIFVHFGEFHVNEELIGGELEQLGVTSSKCVL